MVPADADPTRTAVDRDRTPKQGAQSMLITLLTSPKLPKLVDDDDAVGWTEAKKIFGH